MNLNISFKHHDTSDAVKDYTSERSERLAKYFQGKIHCTWNFGQVKQQWTAHCHLVGNNIDYFGEADTDDIYASIDVTVDRLEKQLRKHKEIVTNHLHREHANPADFAAPEVETEEESEDIA